jgi:hypothetical protein
MLSDLFLIKMTATIIANQEKSFLQRLGIQRQSYSFIYSLITLMLHMIHHIRTYYLPYFSVILCVVTSFPNRGSYF